MKYISYLFMSAVMIIVIISATSALCATEVAIEIDTDRVIGEVDPYIYGNNLIGDNTYLTRSTRGEGIWDPRKKEPVSEVVDFAKGSGMSIVRFPGGAHSAVYNWKKTIGPLVQRPDFLFGLDEFLQTSEAIGCDVVFTLPYFTGTPQDAADLVEYLNAPADGSNPGGGVDWADKRARNGHPDPYNVKYFELGNEVYDGFGIRGFAPADPKEYATAYTRYRQAMREIDSKVELGAVTVSSDWSKGLSPWNEKLFRGTGGAVDFLIEHTYFHGISPKFNGRNEEVFFTSALNELTFIDDYLDKLSGHFKSVTGKENIPFAITEYNSGFKTNDPLPLRHTLGAALVNAGLLQIFMKPEHNVIMANYWQFVNSYWGMIKNDNYLKGVGSYTKRPNYLVYQMYHDHFGSDLVHVSADNSGGDDAQRDVNLLEGAGWRTYRFSGEDIDINGDEVGVTFSGKNDTNFYHVYKKVSVKPSVTYQLTGRIRAENLIDNEGVSLQVMDGRGWGKTRSAVQTERVWGTTGWVNVKMEYTTLADASSVSVIVRRVSRHGKVKGKVFVKDVRLTEKKDMIPQGKDALLITASRNEDGDKLYLLVLNKNVKKDITASINTKKAISSVNVWTLNGDSLLDTNEVDPDNVTLEKTVHEIGEGSRGLTYSFPAHSFTSIELKLK